MMALSPSESFSDGSVFQNSVYIGINIQNILYGVLLVLYFKTIRILLARRRGARKKSNLFYALFSSAMVLLITVWVATQAIFGEQMWLIYDGYPGGPDAYWKVNISAWYMDCGTTSIIILQLMTDALMIYRCRIIWDSYLAVMIPVFLWLSTLVLGFFVDWTTSSPGGDFFTGVASQIGLSYYTVSVFLNTILTCMICYRMLRHGKRIREGLGREYASLYFSVIMIVVESVIPYTISGIAFLVSLGMGSPTSVAFICVYVLMMCISPQMLILRVIMGRAWEKDTGKPGSSTLEFSPGGTSESQWFDGVGARCVHLQTLSDAYIPDGHGKVLASQV